MQKHAVDWFEIAAADFDRAVRFYEAILDLKTLPMPIPNGPKMAMFPVDPAAGVGGAICHHAEWYKPSKDGTLVYLNADPDLSTVLGRVEKAGGKVVVPKTRISEQHGYMAVFIDSEGNRMALHSRN
jgi:predicted enzyme related to lactoylglutathione lyase